MRYRLTVAFLFAVPFTFAFACGYGIRGVSVPEIPEVPRAEVTVRNAPALHRYPVEKVLRVVDGDTVDVRFYVWEDLMLVKRLRLLGVDTPELRPRKGTEAEREAEKLAAVVAKDYVEKTLTEAAAVFVVSDWQTDSFGRVLAGIKYTDKSGTEQDLAAILLQSGYAKPYEK